jgi:beta-barrel assembly-enhancing protease
MQENKGYPAAKYIMAIVSIFFLLLTLGGCAVNPVSGRSELMLVSEQEEIEMGRRLYPNALYGAEGGGGEYKDEQLKNYLKSIVVDIHRVSHRPNLPVDFAIQNSTLPNAWAIPGHVVITRGLLAGLDNEGEFTFVMGHEMGHVAARHSASQMSYGMLSQILVTGAGVALAGSQYSDAALTFGSLGAGLLLLKYSRDDELEADRLGLQYMTRLGYNPQHALGAHKNLERISSEYMKSLGQSQEERSFFGDLLTTHPRTSVRVEEIQHMMNQFPQGPRRGDGTNRGRFQEMVAGMRKSHTAYRDYYDKAVVAAKKGNMADASSLISKALAADSNQAAFHGLNGLIMLERKNYDGAERSFNAALRLDQAYQPAHRGLGVLRYVRENYPEAIQYLQRSVALFPEDISSRYFLGMTHYKTKAYKSAIGQLAPVAQAQPRHPRIHGVLGACYEAVGDSQSAYNAYVMQVKVDPNSEAGKQAAGRAKVLGARMR